MTIDGEPPSHAQLLQLTGLVGSLSEARRTVKEGGAYVNNERVTDADAVPGADAWLPGGGSSSGGASARSPGSSGPVPLRPDPSAGPVTAG
ncbi:hypothetical protein [Blastococcus brunescens]|uniref:RNA-binding S4 domain-containing protein n=1 Tax=Blastococcus brunescens TaxID=1564165 RepID=A0ABZ1B7G1_9ACTN|nr:hypothetical protein [Blastococcus sp. BMG 8361]WRL66317.1 hypothetical protein U6N30_13225 [Blastococcus sp. BMG 8361]